MSINVGQTDLMSAIASVAGAIVLVHARNTMPFPEDYGVMLSPGVFNCVSLRLLQITRLPRPYGDCIDETLNTSLRDVYQEKYSTKYSKVVSSNMSRPLNIGKW